MSYLKTKTLISIPNSCLLTPIIENVQPHDDTEGITAPEVSASL